ncbi:MAG: RNA methyltransferase, partial [Lachnospiraceae bacterium]|nr:RNA methyltransferase [Lachnospiraceae bacterium]
MITSVSNPKIKNVRALLSKKKERDEQGCFVIEGRKPVLEALGSQLEVKEIYLAESFEDEALAGVPEDIAMRVSDRVFSQLSQTVTPQGVAAVVKMPSYSLGDMVSNDASRLLILEDIRDPGNLGTMIRTSEAAGIGGVIMTRNTVDVFNP